nr:rhabdomeric opsin [Pseudechiniscus sp.]
MTTCKLNSSMFLWESVKVQPCRRIYLYTGSYDYLDESYTSRAFIFGMAIGAYFLPLAIVIICYILIVAEVRKSERKFARKARDVRSGGAITADASSSAAAEHAKKSKEVQIAKVIFMVIVCWTIAWTPYLIVSLMGIFFWRELLTPWTSQVPALFAKSGSVYNPVSKNHQQSGKNLRRSSLLFVAGSSARLIKLW